MTDKDTITLPREVVELALEVVELALEVVELSSGGEPIGTMEREAIEALRTALAAEQPKHPGYVIGSHWLETAYSRICAGEAEEEVLRDCGWRRCAVGQGLTQFCAEAEALRRDAERWRHWRDSHGFATIDHEKGRCFVTLICDCDDPDQVRAKRFAGEDSFEWLDAFTDAAMKEGT